MPRTRIDIAYPPAELERNRQRLEAGGRFQYTDRVPVLLGVETRYVLRERRVGWLEYFSDPRTQMHHQLLNTKWLIENVPDDRCTGAPILIYPDWQNVVNASAAGCKVVYSDDEPPCSLPFISTPDEAAAYRFPDEPAGLWAARLEWYRRMSDLREEFQVMLNGEEVPIRVGLFINGDSPFMTALDIAGEHLLAWLLELPDVAHGLLRTITEGCIAVETQFRELSGVPQDAGYWISDDPVAMLSPSVYRRMVVPYTRRILDTFAPIGRSRAMHMCGRNTHVLDILMNDLAVTCLDGFGAPNPPEAYVQSMSGRVTLKGNIDPVLLLNGPVSAIRDACDRVLRVLGPAGGLILADGYNVCPGSPIEHLAALRDSAAELGAPRGWGRN